MKPIFSIIESWFWKIMILTSSILIFFLALISARNSVLLEEQIKLNRSQQELNQAFQETDESLANVVKVIIEALKND